MPTIRLHIPDSDMDLMRRAAQQSGVPLARFIVEAEEAEALRLKLQRKLIKAI